MEAFLPKLTGTRTLDQRTAERCDGDGRTGEEYANPLRVAYSADYGRASGLVKK
jgi:hypothetical protein